MPWGFCKSDRLWGRWWTFLDYYLLLCNFGQVTYGDCASDSLSIKWPTSSSLWGLDEFTHINCLEWYLSSSMNSINISCCYYYRDRKGQNWSLDTIKFRRKMPRDSKGGNKSSGKWKSTCLELKKCCFLCTLELSSSPSFRSSVKFHFLREVFSELPVGAGLPVTH